MAGTLPSVCQLRLQRGGSGIEMEHLSGLKTLYANIGMLITASLRMDEILNGLMEEIRMYFNPENWSLLRLDPASEELFFVVIQGVDHKMRGTYPAQSRRGNCRYGRPDRRTGIHPGYLKIRDIQHREWMKRPASPPAP